MEKRQKFATTSLVWGIIGIPTSIFFGIGIVACILSVIFGIIALLNPNHAKPKAIAGLACSAIGIVICAFIWKSLGNF